MPRSYRMWQRQASPLNLTQSKVFTPNQNIMLLSQFKTLQSDNLSCSFQWLGPDESLLKQSSGMTPLTLPLTYWRDRTLKGMWFFKPGSWRVKLSLTHLSVDFLLAILILFLSCLWYSGVVSFFWIYMQKGRPPKTRSVCPPVGLQKVDTAEWSQASVLTMTK